MTDEGSSQKRQADLPESQTRTRSTIDYPYLDLENAIEVIRAVAELEQDRCEWNQLAAKLAMSPEGGGFRLRMLSSKTFGLLSYERGQVLLSDLGLRIVDPVHEKRARFEAFITVPLFRQLFDRMNGQPLPPVAAIDRMAEGLGVSPKQRDRARMVYLRSAKQAGLFDLSSDRLTTPPGLNGSSGTKSIAPPIQPAEAHGSGGGGGGIELKLDPLLIALLQKIPSQGEAWPQDRRLRWFRTFAMNVSQVYDTDDSPVELTITASGGQGAGAAT